MRNDGYDCIIGSVHDLVLHHQCRLGEPAVSILIVHAEATHLACLWHVDIGEWFMLKYNGPDGVLRSTATAGVMR